MARSCRMLARFVLGVSMLPGLASDVSHAGTANGVVLVDSCGTYVRVREGAGDAEIAGLFERTRLCSDVMWEASEELVARVSKTARELRFRQLEPIRCTLDPSPVDPHQSVRIGYKYLSDHPERLHLEARLLAREALADAFGCEVAAAG
jgi:hypothetical protein